MAQRVAIVQELKRVLKERGMTYADVARQLQLSHASVKRLFSTADFSLERLDAICELAGLELTELIEEMHDRGVPITRLTPAQEREIIADPRLFLVTWLVLNKWPVPDIQRVFRFSDRDILQYLIKLDRLQIIELQPGNRARLRITLNVRWQPDGPMQRYLNQRLVREFLESDFADTRAEFTFNGGVLSDGALAQVRRVLQNAVKECIDITERDQKIPLSQRHGAAYIVAVSPWQYSGFESLKKVPPGK